MKKQALRNKRQAIILRLIPVLFLFLSGTITPLKTLAQVKQFADTPATVKYLGVIDDHVTFQLNFDNTNGEAFYVIIKDEEGTILYNSKSNDRKFSKQFRFSKSELRNSSISVTVFTQNDKQGQVFQISSRVVEDVVVTRL